MSTTNHPTKGTSMTHTEHTPKTPSPRTGLFALLAALLCAKGTSAPKTGTLLAAVSLLAAALLALPAAASAGTCPNEQLRAEAHSTNLPDCRAYELVSPPFKEAARVEFEPPTEFAPHGLAAMSDNGSRVDVYSVGNFGDAQTGFEANDYQLTRTESGWSEHNIDLPASQFPASFPLATTPELGAVLYEARATGQSLKAKDFWLREADGALRDIGPFEPPADTEGPPGTGGGVVGDNSGDGNGVLVGASLDLSHVLFDSPVPWPGDEASGELYEYTVGQGGPPAPVGVEPDGNPCAAEYATPQYLDKGGIGYPQSGMSADGSTLFFTCSGQLFAKLEGSPSVAISEPPKVDCEACDTEAGVLQSPTFDGVSVDGSKAFFATTQPLLGSETETSANIYEYDFDRSPASPADPDGKIVHVTAGNWGPRGVQAEVPYVIPLSEDGSHLYYLAAGKLQGVKNNQGQEPLEDAANPNLYVYDTQTGQTAFIATVAVVNPTVTPNGEFLVFASSTRELTGPEDTSTAQQIFEYDAESGSLVRVSIGQNGAYNDDGNTDTFNAELPGEYITVPPYNYPLAVSDDGAYVVFQSADALTPGALNGYFGETEYVANGGGEAHETYYANNVYEYHDGNVYLISDGQDTSHSTLGLGTTSSSVQVRGLSPSGADIFFDTADRLVPQDVDTQQNLYDARIEGGFPAPISLLPTCSGDACQGQLSPAPTLLSPGSEFQAGESPPLQPVASTPAVKPKSKVKTCKKGYVKKKNKCVKKPKAKKSAKGRK
jgi:hypothetical protein